MQLAELLAAAMLFIYSMDSEWAYVQLSSQAMGSHVSSSLFSQLCAILLVVSIRSLGLCMLNTGEFE